MIPISNISLGKYADTITIQQNSSEILQKDNYFQNLLFFFHFAPSRTPGYLWRLISLSIVLEFWPLLNLKTDVLSLLPSPVRLSLAGWRGAEERLLSQTRKPLGSVPTHEGFVHQRSS